MLKEIAMKNTLRVWMAFCLLIGFAGNALAADSKENKAGETQSKSGPVTGEKASAENIKFDETTTQCLKKLRSINSELVAAHRELYNYNNPEKTTKGISMADILNQESASREAKEQEQTLRSKKARTEEKISNLQKDVEKLKQDLLKHYNGELPKHVSDAWQTEEGYTAYKISKIK